MGSIEQSLTCPVHELLLLGSIVGIKDHHGVLAVVLTDLQVGHRVHPPVISPNGLVEQDQHVVEVLEQSVGLLGDLYWKGTLGEITTSFK